VVGESDGGHAELGRPRGELGNPARSVEDRVLGVDVQMDETGLSHGQTWSHSRRSSLVSRSDDLNEGAGQVRTRSPTRRALLSVAACYRYGTAEEKPDLRYSRWWVKSIP
jgi:hypothetical protein